MPLETRSNPIRKFGSKYFLESECHAVKLLASKGTPSLPTFLKPTVYRDNDSPYHHTTTFHPPILQHPFQRLSPCSLPTFFTIFFLFSSYCIRQFAAMALFSTVASHNLKGEIMKSYSTLVGFENDATTESESPFRPSAHELVPIFLVSAARWTCQCSPYFIVKSHLPASLHERSVGAYLHPLAPVLAHASYLHNSSLRISTS
ncbi:hypothetical protein FN846DRAFT_220556 [Sphaerosporella brunnea]|uniref:Uncharacterized protein n=1 Tax=Sphaerosporella brunnea TaxID=1250544 RepID=A0A5J5F7W1_9PEZI|nr:hypothetical protein FN846DRAFT_220556 [Sphaerosporella brunnea]